MANKTALKPARCRGSADRSLSRSTGPRAAYSPVARGPFSRSAFPFKVDGQFKCSFGSEEAAKTAGAAIKKAYPVVAVTVVDSQEHKTEAINV